MIVDAKIKVILENYKKNSFQGLALIGERGINLKEIASFVSDKKVNYTVFPKDVAGKVDISSGVIKIDDIRELQKFINLKEQNIDVMIFGIDKMNHSAQNAFLKNLEEPVEGVRYIFTGHSMAGVLPTILSRINSVTVPRISDEESRKFLLKFKKLEQEEVAQILFLASGRVEAMNNLVENKKEREKIAKMVKEANIFLASDKYTRFCYLMNNLKKKQDFETFLDAIILVSGFNLEKKVTHELHEMLSRAYSVKNELQKNKNLKLQILNFVI